MIPAQRTKQADWDEHRSPVVACVSISFGHCSTTWLVYKAKVLTESWGAVEIQARIRRHSLAPAFGLLARMSALLNCCLVGSEDGGRTVSLPDRIKADSNDHADENAQERQAGLPLVEPMVVLEYELECLLNFRSIECTSAHRSALISKHLPRRRGRACPAT